MLKLFISKDCGDCAVLKIWLRKYNLSYETFDIGTENGLAEALFYNVAGSPSFVVVEDKEAKVISGITEVKKYVVENFKEKENADKKESS